MDMGPRQQRARWAAGTAVVLVVVLAGGLSCRRLIHPCPPRFLAPQDLATHPPQVQSLGVQLDPQSGAMQLLVKYAPDARLEPELTLDLGAGPTLFRDDGMAGDAVAHDRVYTGTAPLTAEALNARWREIAAIMSSKDVPPQGAIFSGREIGGFVALPSFDSEMLEMLNSDLLMGKPVDLDLLSTCSLSTIDPKASLFITHPAVMHDPVRTYLPCSPNGPEGTPGSPWSFGYLMRQLAGGPSTSDAAVSAFIRNWLDQWKQTQGVNGEALPPRPLLDSLIVQPWKAASASSGLEFDPAKAPFRLLGIVNRIDRSDSVVYGASSAPRPGNAGEVRFIFGAVSSQCQPLHFSVIFEYTVDRGDCRGIAQWARDWIALSTPGLGLGSEAYRSQLVKLTAQVVTPGTLGQLRTNEISLDDPNGGSAWDLREFRLVGGQLLQHTVAQAPRQSVDGTTVLRDYINANGAAIVREQYEVPPTYPGTTPFLGDHVFGKPDLTFWDAPGILPVAGPTPTPAAVVRHVFSRNTCNGCHNAETGANGTQVNPMVDPDAPGQLSGFLTGISGVVDPVAAAHTYAFNDLQRRSDDLAAAANLGCVCQLVRRPIAAPH